MQTVLTSWVPRRVPRIYSENHGLLPEPPSLRHLHARDRLRGGGPGASRRSPTALSWHRPGPTSHWGPKEPGRRGHAGLGLTGAGRSLGPEDPAWAQGRLTPSVLPRRSPPSSAVRTAFPPENPAWPHSSSYLPGPLKEAPRPPTFPSCEVIAIHADPSPHPGPSGPGSRGAVGGGSCGRRERFPALCCLPTRSSWP